jgi:hypothetical protein
MKGGLVSPPDSRNNSPTFPSGSSSTLLFPNISAPHSIDNRQLNVLRVSSSDDQMDGLSSDTVVSVPSTSESPDRQDQAIGRPSLDEADDQMDGLSANTVVSVLSMSESSDRQGPYDCSSVRKAADPLDTSGLLPIDDFPMTLLDNPALEEVEEVDDEMDGPSLKMVASGSLNDKDVVMAEEDLSSDDPMAGLLSKMAVSNDVTLEKMGELSEDHEDEYAPPPDGEDDVPGDEEIEDPPADEEEELPKGVVDEYAPPADGEDDMLADEEDKDLPADEEEELPAIVVKSKKLLSDSSGESEAGTSDLSSDEGSDPSTSQVVDKLNVLKTTNEKSTDSDSDSYSGLVVTPPEPRRSSRKVVSKNKASTASAAPSTSTSGKRKPVIKNVNHILMKASF